MKVEQLFSIGEFARNEKKYTLAVPWLELTLQKLSEDKEYDNSETTNFVSGLMYAAMMEVTYF